MCLRKSVPTRQGGDAPEPRTPAGVVGLLRDLGGLHPERRWPLLARLGGLRPLAETFLALHPDRRHAFLARLAGAATPWANGLLDGAGRGKSQTSIPY